MKTKHLLLSLLSTLLIAAGLLRAAERFDPVAKATPARATTSTVAAPDCGMPCDTYPPGRL